MKNISYVATICAIVVLMMLITWTPLAQAAAIQMGLLTADEALGPVAEAAYDWSGENYPSTLLVVDGSGDFSDDSGNKRSLNSFAVLWLHYSETGTLPDVFLTDETQDAIKGYLEAGGTMFLSALGLKYTFNLEVETGGDPRVFTPLGKDPPEIGVLPTAEGVVHPIFAGFDTSAPIYLCSMAQDGSTSDFNNLPKDTLDGILLATKTRGGGAGAGERPIVEYDVGDGKIMTLGHHNAVYTATGSPESDNLRNLTTNIIDYLAANSAFSPVEPGDKLATTWGKIK